MTETVQYVVTFIHDKRSVTAITNSQDKITKGNKTMGTSFTRMALRAASVIPIWLALRSAYMSVFRTMQMGIKHIVDFDKAMARVTAVTHGVENVKEFVAGLKTEIQELALETGKSVRSSSTLDESIVSLYALSQSCLLNVIIYCSLLISTILSLSNGSSALPTCVCVYQSYRKLFSISIILNVSLDAA